MMIFAVIADLVFLTLIIGSASASIVFIFCSILRVVNYPDQDLYVRIMDSDPTACTIQ